MLDTSLPEAIWYYVITLYQNKDGLSSTGEVFSDIAPGFWRASHLSLAANNQAQVKDC